jgi:dTDP-4-amino-4,6-dideoxygalactose transaminase
MDPSLLRQTLSELGNKTETSGRLKALVPVHAFGQMADMSAITDLAEAYGLPVVEDAACALGATLHGQQAGTWGVMGCFSFHPRKAITTGEGGIIVTNDDKLAHYLRAARNHGLDPSSPDPDFIMAGFNYRMTEVQAALGLAQMNKLERIVTTRQRLAFRYSSALADSSIRAPLINQGSQPVFQSYVTLLPEYAASQRSDLIQYLKEEDIETTIGTWDIPSTTFFRNRYGYQHGDFPHTNEVFRRSLTLPLFEGLCQDEQDRIIHHLKAALQALGRH